MKIYLLQEIHYNYNELSIDWFNTYPYTNVIPALEYIADKINEPLKDVLNYFVDSNEIKSNDYTYRIEKVDLLE